MAEALQACRAASQSISAASNGGRGSQEAADACLRRAIRRRHSAVDEGRGGRVIARHIAQSKGELQEVHGPSCSPTQANQDKLAAVTDIPTLWGCSFHDQSSSDVSPSGQSPEEVADPQAKQMEELKQRIQLIKLELAIEHEKRHAAKAALQKEVEQTTLL